MVNEPSILMPNSTLTGADMIATGDDVAVRAAMEEGKVLAGGITEEKKEALEHAMLDKVQVDCPVTHHFGPGVCIREVFVPAGTFAMGHFQATTHMNVMLKGRVLVLNDDGGTKELVAPCTFVAPPGRKIGYVIEDMVWQNVYATDETDVESIERLYLRKSVSFQEHKKIEQLRLGFEPRDYDRADFLLAIKEYGLEEAQVREMSENTEDQIPFPIGSFKVKISESMIEGKGVVATGQIQAGELIGPTKIKSLRTPLGRYTNHAKYPNAEIVELSGDIHLVALRPIAGCKGGRDGEEVTVDYRKVMDLNRRTICQP